jgi:hypothetical protein
MKEEAEKEIKKMQPVIDSLRLEKKEAKELFQLTHSYFNDAKYFFEKRKFLQAFEAAVICWAYIDAGLHVGIFTIDSKFSKMFTKD